MLVTNRYLPAIGRFLIVVTFIEDALRIITQWNDQLLYLHDYRHSTSNPSLVESQAGLPPITNKAFPPSTEQSPQASRTSS